MRRGFWLIGIGILVLAAASADEPLPAVADKKVYSLNKKFYAFLDVRKKLTTVHQVGKPGKLWEMQGWFRVAALSNDGEYLVVGYHGMNLLNLNYSPDQVMLSFYRLGKLIRTVTLNELVRDLGHLQRTASHYLWGSYLGFDKNNHYLVETVEKRTIAFDVTTGKPIDAQ